MIFLGLSDTPVLPDIQTQIPDAAAAAASATAANRRANAAYWVSITSGTVAVVATVAALWHGTRRR